MPARRCFIAPTSPHTSSTVVRATRSYWRAMDEMLTTAGLTAQASATSAPSSRLNPRALASPKMPRIVHAANTRLSARPVQTCCPVTSSHPCSNPK